MGGEKGKRVARILVKWEGVRLAGQVVLGWNRFWNPLSSVLVQKMHGSGKGIVDSE